MTWKSNPTRQGWTQGQHIYITAVCLFTEKKGYAFFWKPICVLVS